MLGTSRRFGSIVIRRSTDGGYTWTEPYDRRSGLLFSAGEGMVSPNYHTAPMPVLNYRGRLYRAFEDFVPPERSAGSQSFIISCGCGDDLLEADHWMMSNKLEYDQAADPPGWGERDGGQHAGWLEGNMVETDNGLVNVIRLDTRPFNDFAAILRVEDAGRSVSFDPQDFVTLPGGHHKFTIRRDPESKLYWTIANKGVDESTISEREILSLFVSRDLRCWQHVKTLLMDDTGLTSEQSRQLTGFQYTDWQFDGPHLLYVVRVAYDGAANYHDSNRIVFGRIEHFRRLASDK